MWRRIRIYMFGVGLGLVVTWALVLRNRNADEYLMWTPSERILGDIRADSNTVLPDNFNCLLDCIEITSLDYENLTHDGKVNYKRSSPRENPKIYLIEHEVENRMIEAVYEFTETEQRLVKLSVANQPANCECNEQ